MDKAIFSNRKMKTRSSHESDKSSENSLNFLGETTDVVALLDELMPTQKVQRLTKCEEPEDSIENHLAFLEGIEKDLSNQESGDN